MANFDVQTSYGGLKVSEFNQEFISEVQNYQFKKNWSQINHLQFCIFFLCISPSNPMSMRRDAGIQVLGLSFDFLGSVYPQYIHINCHLGLSTCMTIQDYPNEYHLLPRMRMLQMMLMLARKKHSLTLCISRAARCRHVIRPHPGHCQ